MTRRRKPPQKTHLVVLHIVGTTVQAGDEVPTAFRRALAIVGIVADDEALRAIRGRSKREAIAELLKAARPASEDDVDVVHGRFRAYLGEAYRRGVRAIPGADTAIRRLAERNVAVVLTTGLDGDTARVLTSEAALTALPLAGLVTSDDVRRGRPAPDLIQAAMRIAEVESGDGVTAVGDTTADLGAAAAAGAGRIVGVLTGAHDRDRLAQHPHSVILGSVAELPDWLAGVGAL